MTWFEIAWLSLCFILETSWVALYSDVCVSGIGNTRPNLHFFQYIQAYKPFADPVPPNTNQYQLILTKYQPVSSYTDPVPSSTTYNSSSQRHSSANWIISLFMTHLRSHAQYTWSSYFLSLKSQISRKHFFPLFSSFGKKNDFPFLYSTLQCYVMYWRRDVSLSTKVAQAHVKHAIKNLCAP